MSVRTELESALKPLLPKRWKLIPFQDNLDEIAVPTVMFKLQKFENAAENPKGAYRFYFVITLIEPGTDMSKVEPALDDHVEDLFQILDDRLPWTKPTEAQKVGYGSPEITNLAYDITTEALFAKPPKPTE